MVTNLRACLRRLAFGRRMAGPWPQRRSRGAKLRVCRRLAAESLEPRTLLSSGWTITADYSGPLVNLTFQEDPAGASGGFLNLSLDASGNLTYDFPGAPAPPSPPGPFPITDIGHIGINATVGTDWLVLDFTHGSLVPVEGVDFDGGEDGGIGDVLELFAYDVASLDVAPTGRLSGTVQFPGGSPVAFSQTEWLLLAGTAEELVIDLSQTGVATTDVVNMNPHPTGAGYTTIHGPTLPVTHFVNPTGELTIDFEASSGSGADTVNVEGLWHTFDADLTIKGGGDDTVNFQTIATNLGPTGGNLIVTAGTIDIRQAVTVSGSVNLDAAADITVQPSGTLTASGGSVAIRAGGNVVLGGAVQSGPGQVSLVAGGPIVLESTGRVQTAGGEVRLDSGVAVSMAKGSVIDAGGGDVGVTAEYGVLLGRVVSPGATIAIDARQGGIADGADPTDLADPDGADLEADRAVLHAAGSIGSRAEHTPWGTVVVSLDTKLQRLDAVSDHGVGIFVVNEGALVIERAEARRTDPPLGIVDITTRSPLTVTGVVRGTVVNLTAAEGLEGAGRDDRLTFREGSLVEAVAGAVTLRAGDDLVIEPGATLSSAAGFVLHVDETGLDTADRFDVNGDGAATPLDVLIVIGDLSRHGIRRLQRLTAESLRLDVNRDAQLSPQDVLQIIHHLNRPASSEAPASWPAAVGAPVAPRAEGEPTPQAASVSGVGTASMWRASAAPYRSSASVRRCRLRLELGALDSDLLADQLPPNA